MTAFESISEPTVVRLSGAKYIVENIPSDTVTGSIVQRPLSSTAASSETTHQQRRVKSSNNSIYRLDSLSCWSLTARADVGVIKTHSNCCNGEHLLFSAARKEERVKASVSDRQLRNQRNNGKVDRSGGQKIATKYRDDDADNRTGPGSTEQRLLRTLLRDYDVDARGVINVNETVNVTMEFLLLRIQGLVSTVVHRE